MADYRLDIRTAWKVGELLGHKPDIVDRLPTDVLAAFVQPATSELLVGRVVADMDAGKRPNLKKLRRELGISAPRHHQSEQVTSFIFETDARYEIKARDR